MRPDELEGKYREGYHPPLVDSEVVETECLVCGKLFEFTAEYCCLGVDCCCRGGSTEPPVCSPECSEEFWRRYRERLAPTIKRNGEDDDGGTAEAQNLE